MRKLAIFLIHAKICFLYFCNNINISLIIKSFSRKQIRQQSYQFSEKPIYTKKKYYSYNLAILSIERCPINNWDAFLKIILPCELTFIYIIGVIDEFS